MPSSLLFNRCTLGFIKWLLGFVLSLFAAKLFEENIYRNKREVLLNNSIITINRPGNDFDILFFFFIFALTFSLFAWLLTIRPKKANIRKSAKKLPRFLFRCFLLISGLIVFNFVFLSDILLPKVEHISLLSGRANDRDYLCYLFIRPIGSDTCWLQRPIPLSIRSDGRWMTEVFFSGSSGDIFEVIVIASNHPLHPSPFNLEGGYQSREIPVNIDRYIRLVKIR